MAQQPAPPNTPHRLTRTQSNPATSTSTSTTHTLPLTPALQTRSLGTAQGQRSHTTTAGNSNAGDLRSQLFSRVKEFFITLSSAPGGGGLGSGQLSEVNILVGLTVWLQAKGYAATLMRTAPGPSRPVEHFFVSVRAPGEIGPTTPTSGLANPLLSSGSHTVNASHTVNSSSETDVDADSERALLIDPFYKPFFEIARPTPAYAEYLQRLPTIFIGTQPECHRMVAEITSQIIQSFTSTDMAMAPWRSSAIVSKYWANYRPDTDRVAAHRKRLASAASLTTSPASASASTPALQRTVSADHTATPKTPIRTLSSVPTVSHTTPATATATATATTSNPPRTPGTQPQSAYASAQLSRTKSAPFTPATPQQKKPPTNPDSAMAATATTAATAQSNLHYDSRTSSNSSNSSASDYTETVAAHNTAPQSRYVTRQNSNPAMPVGLQSPATPAAKKLPPAQYNQHAQHNHQLQRTHSTPANLDASAHGYNPQRQNSDQHNHTNAPGFVSPRGAHQSQNQPQQVSKYANLITSPRGNQNQNQNQNHKQQLTSPRENVRDSRNTSSHNHNHNHNHNRNKALNQLEVDKLPGNQILPQNEPGTSKQNSTHAASVQSVVLTNA